MTIYTAPQAERSYPIPTPSIAGVKTTVFGTFQADEELFTGDTIQMCRVPANSVIVGGWFRADKIDGAPETFLGLTIGWEDNSVEDEDTKGLGNYGVLEHIDVEGYKQGTEGYMYPLQGNLLSAPVTLSEETVIIIDITNDASSFVPGGLTVMVDYLQQIELFS